jgi:hypothetical protein
MSTVRKVDTDLATLIQVMNLEPDKDSIVMVDVETNDPTRSDFKKLRIFDFAYGSLNPFSGEIQTPEGSLVYEGMLHPKIIEQIIQWKKIKNASFDSYYGFFNLLVEHDWWSDRVISKQEITAEARERFKLKAREKLYKLQTRVLPEMQRVLRVWETDRSHYKNADKYRADRKADIAKLVKAIKDLTEWIAKGNELDKMIKDGSLTGNPTYDSIMESVYRDLYNDQYERLNWEGDLAFFRRVEQITGARFSGNIKRWGEVITTFDNKLKNNRNLLAITAYNISYEQKAIKAMVADFGPSEKYSKILDGETYRSICMQNMMGLITKQEAIDLINGLHSYDDKFFVENLAKALSTTGKLNTQTFELFYKHIFPTREYKQSHTGKGDVFDQSEAFVEAFQKHLAPLLERRK